MMKGHTNRLLLQPLTAADAPAIQQLFPHWEIVQYMLNRVPWPYPANGAEQFVRAVALPAMAREEAWHWTLRLHTEPDAVIGVLSLLRGERNNRGFWLGLPWQGQGLMTEAAAWANDVWFDRLGFALLRVGKAHANRASRRISEKHGMRPVECFEEEFVCGRMEAEIWELTADEWHARRRRQMAPPATLPAADV